MPAACRRWLGSRRQPGSPLAASYRYSIVHSAYQHVLAFAAALVDCHSKKTPCLSSVRYATRSAILPYSIPEISSVLSSIVHHIKSGGCAVYDLTIATALHSVVCSHCAACGLSQQVATLPELSALCYTLGYLAVLHTGDIKRLQLNRPPHQVWRLRCV